MPRRAALPWEAQIRQLVKANHGRGWTLGPHRGGRTQITRRWSDGTRSSTTVSTPWAPSSGAALLALVERLAGLMSERRLSLAEAAQLVDVEGAGRSAAAIRFGAVDWPAVAQRYRHQRVEVSGELSPRTWHNHAGRHVAEALEALARRPAPRDGRAVLEAVLAARPTEPGKQGRRERVGNVARFMVFAVERCGAPSRYLPPANLGELIGKRIDRAEPATPLLDDQLVRLYRAVPDPRWRLALGLAGVFGLRPIELACCRPEGPGLRVQGVKRNSAGKSADRLVHALDPEGAAGLGAELLALLAERGPDGLPDWGNTPISTKLGWYLADHVPEWAELRAEALGSHQGKLTTYSCRHGYAWRGSQVYGLSPRVLSALMGHNVATHLKHYGGWSGEAETAAAVLAARARILQAPALSG